MATNTDASSIEVDDEGSGNVRRRFLKLAGAAVAGGAAASFVAAEGAEAVGSDVTVDQLPAAAALTGAEVLHGVQTVGAVTSDVAISANQLRSFAVPQGLASSGAASVTWDPTITHLVANNGSDHLTLLLPAYFTPGVTRIPDITVIQAGAGRVAFDVVPGAASTIRSLPMSLTGLTRVHTKGAFSVVSITAVPYPPVTIWVISGDVEAY